MYEYDDDGDDGERSRRRTILAVVAAVALVAVGWFVVRPALTDDTSAANSPLDISRADTSSPGATDPNAAVAATDGVDRAASGDATTESADAARGTDAPDTSRRSTTTARPSTTAATTSTAVTSTSAATTTSTTDAPTTTAPPTTAAATYETLPDGTPAPVIAIFDVDQITLSGAVPSQAAVERLTELAIANSKTPATVNNQLTINPAVPITVGVRVIELNSVRFPESSGTVLPAHAIELDRVAAIMEALPHITVLVVGHADQRGDEVQNFLLSEERARAVVTYLVAKGIAPSRLASRAVGANDLLTLNNDEAALALNRRTEFVFYGLLIE